MKYPKALITLIRELGRLPGIGPKSAQRLAFHLFNSPDDDITALAQALLAVKAELKYCPRCFNITDSQAELCSICTSPQRDTSILCVVEQPADVIAIERSGEYQGLYHVLQGALSPMNGVGPEQLTISTLLARLEPSPESPTTASSIQEIVLATSTTVEGEATAMYLAKVLGEIHNSEMGNNEKVVSRIAYGLPVGGDLEYADEVTLGRAITNRSKL